jgi:hypothetical protein
MSITRRYVTTLLLLMSATTAWAWSAEGHQTVGLIAQQQLIAAGQFGPFKTLLATLNGNFTLADLATCPDEIKEYLSDHAKTGYVMSPACTQVFPLPLPTGTNNWHYVNIPVTLTNPTAANISTACAKVCALVQIKSFGEVLGNTAATTQQRLQALSFLVHFIGDIHQPLHAAVRGDDAGGNAEQVSVTGQKYPDTSLHHAWDEPLVSTINADPQALATDLAKEIAAAAKLPVSQPSDWAVESFQLAKTHAYTYVDGSKTITIPPQPPGKQNAKKIVATLDDAYQKQGQLVVRQQLARGGVRLAQYLNTAVTSPQPGAKAATGKKTTHKAAKGATGSN